MPKVSAKERLWNVIFIIRTSRGIEREPAQSMRGSSSPEDNFDKTSKIHKEVEGSSLHLLYYGCHRCSVLGPKAMLRNILIDATSRWVNTKFKSKCYANNSNVGLSKVTPSLSFDGLLHSTSANE